MFSLNLRHLSPRAYNYIRTKFNNHLPHPATIRKWFEFSNAQANGGFVDGALQTIKKLAEEFKANNNKTIHVSISFDEMSIRKHVQWLSYKKQFSGFINLGTIESTNDGIPIATNALVVMLNGINVNVTIPIAHFFVITPIAEEKAILIASIVKILTDIGIRVLNVTSDGLHANFAAYEILGASFAHENLVPYFINASNGSKVYVIHDPPHIIKLVRNCFGDYKQLMDRNMRPIEWKFVERLYRTNSDLSSHKLTKRHLDWKNTPMKVSLATQVLSSTVAQSIRKLNASDNQQFADSDGTAEYIERFNDSFDILNSDEDVPENVYKTPINSNNLDSKSTVFNFIDDMMDYIDGLTYKGRPILSSMRSTGFLGFKSNFTALKMIVEEFVDTKIIERFRTVSVQQDYVESFFGRIRSGLGNNTNPTQEQFCAIFRRILINKELTCSALANCVDKLDILTIPSSKTNKKKQSEPNYIMINEFANVYSEESENIEENIEDIVFDENIEEPMESINEISEVLGIANVAGTIETLIERNKKFNCEHCSTIFEINEKIDPNLFVKQNKNSLPCKSSLDICKISNNEMSKYLNSVHESRFDFVYLFNKIKTKISIDNLFIDTDFEHERNHRIFIVDLIIEEFVRIRAVQRARQITLNQHKSLVRSLKTHDIHFAGQ